MTHRECDEARSDRPDEPTTGPGDEPIQHVVIAVHGIRTFGDWQDKLRALLVGGPGVRFYSYRYGYFSALAFLFPPLRWLAARRFSENLRTIYRNHPGAAIDVVAHSFGTYLAAKALPDLQRERHCVRTLILAGSVLKPSFPWYRYLNESGCVRRLVNDCGTADNVLLLSQAFAPMMGMAGRRGFNGTEDSHLFLNRYHHFGHGGYFEGEFMERNWVPLLRGADLPEAPPPPERPRRGPLAEALRGTGVFLLNNAEIGKVAVALLLLFLIYKLPVSTYRQKQALDQVRHYDLVTHLSNAQFIPGRDPDHVEELLRRDLPESASLDLGTRASRLADDGADAGAADAEEPPAWMRWVGLAGPEAVAFHAMRKHAAANAELAIREGDKAADKGKAAALYAEAAALYDRSDGLVRGSHALCLLDYARVLADLGQRDRAIAVFRRAPAVFPEPDDAEPARWPLSAVLGRGDAGRERPCPQSVWVDALCGETDALMADERWDDAAERLLDAERHAKEPARQPKLLGQVYLATAWLDMEQLQVERALEDFKRARLAYDDVAEADDFIVRHNQFWIRHGEAMATRLRGRPGEAAREFDALIADIRAVLEDDYKFLPKQRRDLRSRLANSLWRRADCVLFGNPHGQFGSVAAPFRGGEDLGHLDEAYNLYDEAYELLDPDDQEQKAILLYKKYIAHFMALPCRTFAADHFGPGQDVRPPRDLDGLGTDPRQRSILCELWKRPAIGWYREAERTYRTTPPAKRSQLDIYRRFANACFGFRDAPLREPFRPASAADAAGIAHTSGPGSADEARRAMAQAHASLRALIRDAGNTRKTMQREGIEMLLLASEVLVDHRVLSQLRDGAPGDRPDDIDGHLADDADLFSVLIGSATKGSFHDELKDYVRRFNQIAAASRADDSKHQVADAAEPAPAPAALPSPAPPRLVFYLDLGGGLRLSLARGVADGSRDAPTDIAGLDPTAIRRHDVARPALPPAGRGH